MPSPERSGYLFTGWLTSDGSEPLSQLTNYPISQDTKFTAIWQPQPETSTDSETSNTPETSAETEQTTPKESDEGPAPDALSTSDSDQPSEQESDAKYSIQLDNAAYQQDVGTSNQDTVNFSHANANFPTSLENVLSFLNEHVSVRVDYTVTYEDAAGNQATVKRNGVPLRIEWTDQNINPNDVTAINEELKTMDGEPFKVRPSDDYLKTLIAGYEETQSSDQSPDAFELTSQDFEIQGTDKIALTIKIGSRQNEKDASDIAELHTIDTVSPNNVTLNLFDYWLSDRAYNDRNDQSAAVLCPFGINKGHGLLFFANGAPGTWNAWTGAKAGTRTGIVQDTLGENEYPVLNLGNTFNANGKTDNVANVCGQYEPEESLEYLFDPAKVNSSDGGKAYTDVKDLFKVDESGNYYYSSHDNFAEYDPDPNKNAFNVYDTWGVKKGGSSPNGQFFPFNTVDQVFDVDSNGNLTQSSITSTNDLINHYLGLTMTADFQQPTNGMVSVGANARPMVFEFSGDDDVWIFIDDVLVADLGGIHDEASMQVDFSTGEVTTYLAADPNRNRTKTTLRDLFEKAGVTTGTFNGDTFGGNTRHTLKMFYLERGNYDSNLTLSFNLMEPKNDTLIKLDQDGEPVAGAKFSIYPAKKLENGEYAKTSDDPIETVLTSDTDGNGMSSDANGMVQLPYGYDFGQHDYYILEEDVPEGYFSPGQVVLRYDRFQKYSDGKSSGTNLLMVENRWETGAVNNFSATVYQAGTLKYDDGTPIKNEIGQQGLILAVPLLKGTDGKWHPLYGSNMSGFHDVSYQSGSGDETDKQRQAILKAALYQIYGANHQDSSDECSFREWYLEWNQEQGRYEGDLIDLPGDASRYYWASGDPDADLSVAYYFLDLQALGDIFGGEIVNKNSQEKLASIVDKIDAKTDKQCAAESTDAKVQCAVESLTAEIDGKTTDNGKSGFALLDVSGFNRVFSSRIYIPNVQPELTVRKLDEKGNPLENVGFSLYKGEEQTTALRCATGTTDSEGRLVFSAAGTGQQGSAHVVLEPGYYWVKETSTPTGYTSNGEVIPVYVTESGRVYADALDENDGITVRKGLGRLVETMVRYAAEDSVNVTLQDVTATLVTVDSNGDTASTGESLNLHYGLDNALLEYGTHEVNGVRPNPYFEVDKGIPGIQVRQNYDAHKGDNMYSSVAAKIDLRNTNIRGLFTGSTTIVVRNRKTDSQGSFSVAKTVTGSDVETDKAFEFDVSIKGTGTGEGAGDVSWSDRPEASYAVTGTDDTGRTLESGTLTFEKFSDQEWRITAVSTKESIYFTRNESNESYYRMRLGNGQKISVTGVPFGMTVSVREMNADGYVTSIAVNNKNPEQSDDREASGVVARPVGDPNFHFYNHKDKTADLTLKKLLPDEPDSTMTFPFTIDLQSSSGGGNLAGTYKYTVTSDESATPPEEKTFTGGKLTVELGNGDVLRIEGLPVGTQYIIKETTKGYAPTVTVDGASVKVKDGGTISGTIGIKETEEGGSQDEEDDSQSNDNVIEYSNTRSGSITITKRNGTGQLLSGAGFSLYTCDNGTLVEFKPQKMTELAMRHEITQSDTKFDEKAMRYNDGTESYAVHTADDDTTYFYYRFLTEDEQMQYYAGTLPGKENVEAIVQFTELPLDRKYAIRETRVPDGYVQNADFEKEMSNIMLPKRGVYDLLYTVVNHKPLTLPTSGLDGIGNILGVGLLLTTLAAALLWIANRRIPGAGPDPRRHPHH